MWAYIYEPISDDVSRSWVDTSHQVLGITSVVKLSVDIAQSRLNAIGSLWIRWANDDSDVARSVPSSPIPAEFLLVQDVLKHCSGGSNELRFKTSG
jgi:hypothetical protein